MRQPSAATSTNSGVTIATTNNTQFTDDDSCVEQTVYRLSVAGELRCTQTSHPQQADDCDQCCGHCETCVFGQIVQNTKQWFPRASDNSKLKFLVGVTQRFNSYELLEYVLHLLKPATEYKDFIYARSRTQPSLQSDHTAISGDRALTVDKLNRQIMETWQWFERGRYWTKANYMLALMKLCSMQLLNLLSNQLHTVRTRQKRSLSSGKSRNMSAGATVSHARSVRPISECFDIPATLPPCTPVAGNTTTNYSDNESIIFNDDDSSSSDCSFDPTCSVIAISPRAQYGITKYKDFIRCLPVHLSKYILNFVDKPTLYNALCVSAAWRLLVEEVLQEVTLHRALQEEVAVMQGASAKGCSPVYAKDVTLLVPELLEGGLEVKRLGEYEPPPQDLSLCSDMNISTAYRGVVTRPVYTVEKNIYCGPYNTMILSHHEDTHRVIHYGQCGQFVVIGSLDRKVRLIYIEDGREKDISIHGHAGSIHCVYICEPQGFVISGSYDTSIRCWSLDSGQCLKIFRGHVDTVTCLSMFDDMIVSGSKDTTVKLWSFTTGGKAIRTFRHKHTVNTVHVIDDTVVSGCDGGFVKVWSIKNAVLVKTLEGHQKAVHCVTFDKWNIASGGGDGYVLVWSLLATFKRCLGAFRHPRPVLCISMSYLRVVTGCEDGKLRVWNVLTGECLRVLRGNSRSDPIQNMLCSDQRMVINTLNNLLVLNFEEVEWDYTLANDKVAILKHSNLYSEAPLRYVTYPHVRAFRMLKRNASDTRLLHAENSNNDGLQMRTNSACCRVTLPHNAKTLSRNSLQSARSDMSRITIDNNTNATSTTKPRTPCKSRLWNGAFTKLSTVHDKLTLSEVKSLMRSQLRQKEVSSHHSDHVYLTLGIMDNMKRRNSTDVNTCQNAGMSATSTKSFIPLSTGKRPSSSPPKCDPRERTQLSNFSEFNPKFKGAATSEKNADSGYELPTTRIIVTDLVERPVFSKTYRSMFVESTRSTIPKPALVRPDSPAKPRRPKTSPLCTTANNPIKTMPLKMNSISPKPLTVSDRKPVAQVINPFISHGQLGLLTHDQHKLLLIERETSKNIYLNEISKNERIRRHSTWVQKASRIIKD